MSLHVLGEMHPLRGIFTPFDFETYPSLGAMHAHDVELQRCYKLLFTDTFLYLPLVASAFQPARSGRKEEF